VRPGRNIFLAETSATCGGLDSLLEPHGTIKAAQELAAQTFGSDRSFWVTNGTSTANKIVVQGLVRPGDIVLVDRSASKPLFIYICYLFVTDAGSRNCHKSHHLGLALVGASVVYLEAYPLRQVLAQRMRAATDVARTSLTFWASSFPS
jgi:arginine decarboxylase